MQGADVYARAGLLSLGASSCPDQPDHPQKHKNGGPAAPLLYGVPMVMVCVAMVGVRLLHNTSAHGDPSEPPQRLHT